MIAEILSGKMILMSVNGNLHSQYLSVMFTGAYGYFKGLALHIQLSTMMKVCAIFFIKIFAVLSCILI